MSWAIDHTGTKDGVTKAVTADLDGMAKNYEGKPEADDIAAIKGRVLAILAILDLSAENAHVRVQANGSNSTGDKGLVGASAGFQISRVFLKI